MRRGLAQNSLLSELKASGHRTILVDDATPDPRIARCLAKLTTNPRVEVIINARNLGFIGSVNRALDSIKQGDVILLNSDTIVPRGFIDRLAAAARSSPDIGTVTPLSNNGEFASFPLPNSCQSTEVRDARSNDWMVSRRRLTPTRSSISPVELDFAFTLRALALIASVRFPKNLLEATLKMWIFAYEHETTDSETFVRRRSMLVTPAQSHSGGRSAPSSCATFAFWSDDFLAIVRNAQHFLEADPLRPARQALERIAASVACHPQLFVTGGGAIGTITRHRASSVSLSTAPALILEVRHRADGALVNIKTRFGRDAAVTSIRSFSTVRIRTRWLILLKATSHRGSSSLTRPTRRLH